MGLRTSAMAATYPRTRAQKRRRREAEEAKEANRKGKSLAAMPPLVLLKVAERLERYDRIAFALTCTSFRDAIWEVVKRTRWGELLTDLSHYRSLSEKPTTYTLEWFKWVYGSFEREEGWEPWSICGEDIIAPVNLISNSQLMKLAAFQGSIEAMEWLRNQGLPLSFPGYSRNYTWNYTVVTAKGGSIEALQWLRSEGCEFDKRACRGAAQGGHFETLKWLRKQDPPCPWDEGTCTEAAEGGHLEILKWVRGQNPPCPWDEWSCASAARGGHLETLKWLRNQNPPCPWDKWVSAHAAKNGDLAMLQWARAQDPPCPLPVIDPYEERNDYFAPPDPCAAAAQGGHFEILKCLRSQDPPCGWNAEVCWWASYRGDLAMLKWARSQEPRCPWSRRQCKNCEHAHIISWIEEVEDESDSEGVW